MSDFFRLNDDHTVTPCTMEEWVKEMESRDAHRKVGNDNIGDHRVSTVFLGMDHNFGGDQPILYETMIFGPMTEGMGEYQTRAHTWAEAEVQHQRAVDAVRAFTGVYD